MKLKMIGLIIIVILFSKDAIAQCPYSQYKTFTDTIFVKNDQIICPHLTYVQPGSSRILMEKSIVELQMIANFIQKYPHYKFEIGLYTEHLGNSEFNLKVSEQRANVIKDYLVSTFSLNPQQLTTKGYGEADLIYKEEEFTDSLSWEEQRLMHNCNRRTVLKVLTD